MTKGALIFEGNEKQVFATDHPDQVIFRYKDVTVAYNNVKRARFKGKGALDNQISAILLDYLNRNGVETHFIEVLGDQEQLCRKIEIIPLQVVVHNRSEKLHEVFAYNLYPGPSAKKGVFSMLLDIGEHEGWVTNHASAAVLETPYENEVVFMHEGASGGGKSEMLEEVHKEENGQILLGTHTVTGEKYYLNLSEIVAYKCRTT